RIAVVPELVATQCSTPCHFAKPRSKSSTERPVSWVSLPESSTSATAVTSSGPRKGQRGKGSPRVFGPPSIASLSGTSGTYYNGEALRTGTRGGLVPRSQVSQC